MSFAKELYCHVVKCWMFCQTQDFTELSCTDINAEFQKQWKWKMDRLFHCVVVSWEGRLFEVKEMDACNRYRVQSAVKNGAHVSLLHTFNLAIFKSSVFKYVKDTCSN